MTWLLAVGVALVVFAFVVHRLASKQTAPAIRGAEPKRHSLEDSNRTHRSSKDKSKGKADSVPSSSPNGKKAKPSKGAKSSPALKVSPAVLESIRPLSVPPPPIDLDDEWEDVDVTVVAELPDEIKAMQKGYRSVDPKQAVAQIAEEYDDTAEIEIIEERLVDGLLVEELLNDEDTGPNALMLPIGEVLTDVGRRRPNNEDRPLSLPEHFVFGVADGMGGHAAGEVASKIAMETIEKAFEDNVFEGEPNSLWPRRGDELARGIEMANRNIFRVAMEDDALSGMGTTVTAIRFCPERQRAYIAHVGDSRCYRFREGQMRQLTKDHTLGAELGAKGKMATHLSRSVGIAETVEVDLMVDAPRVGDRYLLCTDGLTKMLSEERILEISTDGIVADCVRHLIDEANDNGGKDNITVALVEIREPVGTGMT